MASENNVPGIVAVSAVTLLSSIGFLGSNYHYLGSMSIFNEMDTLLTEAGSDSLSGKHASMIIGIVGGCVAIIASILGFISSFINSKNAARTYFFLVVTGSILMLLPAFMMGGVSDTILSTLDKHPNYPQGGFSADQQAVVDVSAAVYNKCCFPKYYDPVNTQSKIEKCEENPPKELVCSLPQVIDDNLDLIPGASSLTPKLCTCKSYEEEDSSILKGMEARDTCSTLKDMRVKVDSSVVIPTTSVQLTQFSGIESEYGDFIGNLDYFTMVASPLPHDFVEEGETIGYGCGIGFVKVLTWTHMLYIEEVRFGPTLGGYVCASVNIVCVAVLMIYWAMGGGKEESFDDLKQIDMKVAA